MTEPAFRRMTAEEYLRTERESPVNREFVDAMLKQRASDLGCRPYAADMKLMPSP